jgi:uncharacterized damage-inducible protein DinB
MSATDEARLHELLASSTEDLRNAVADIAEDQSRAKPIAEGWSALDCVEHVVLVDDGFSARLATAEDLPEPLYRPELENQIRTQVPLREKRFNGPEQVHPKGRYANLTEALASLTKSRERLAQLITDRAADLRSIKVNHPALGELTGYEAFLLLAAHASRHANQIREIKSCR